MRLGGLALIAWLLPSAVGLLRVAHVGRWAFRAAGSARPAQLPRTASGWRLRAGEEGTALSTPPLDQVIDVGVAREGSMDRAVAEEVRALLRVLCMIDEKEGTEGLERRAGLLLTENSHLLCKGRVFEQTISEELQRISSPAQSERLERVHSMVAGFLHAERKSRARTKVILQDPYRTLCSPDSLFLWACHVLNSVRNACETAADKLYSRRSHVRRHGWRGQPPQRNRRD